MTRAQVLPLLLQQPKNLRRTERTNWEQVGSVRLNDHARRVAAVGFTGALSLLTGCAITAVQPWEKGLLAQPAMIFDADRLDAAFLEHTYSSKEAIAGGAGVGGGGCGCN
jgi:hypothetical protein